MSMEDFIREWNSRPEVIAFKQRLERLESEGWIPIYKSAPKDGVTIIRVICEDDSIHEGVLEPYHCGSDCPCTSPSDPDAHIMYEMFGKENCEPQCWTLKGVEPLATHWKPIDG